MNEKFDTPDPFIDLPVTAPEILRLIRVSVFLTDLEGSIIFWNQASEMLFGYAETEALGMNISSLYHARYEDSFKELIDRALNGERISEKWLGVHKDGTPVWIHSDSVPYRNEKGKIVYMITAAFDFRAQKNMEEKLEQSKQRADVILNTTVDAIISIDRYGIIQSFNKAAERIFGYLAEEIIGENVNILMPHTHSGSHDKYIRSYRESGENNIIGKSRELRGKRKNGEIFPIEVAVGEAGHKDQEMFTAIIKDITERRELESEIIKISEEERRRIGQDLHDGLGQMLTGIGLMCQNLLARMEANKLPAADELREITHLIKEADKQARTLSHGLVPVELNSVGLCHALEQLCKRAEKLFSIDCTFKGSCDVEIRTEELATHLFRITQEAISNAVKHGKATHVKVLIEDKPESLVLRIEDNGTGFKRTVKNKKINGMGIHTMRYRAHISGGELHIIESNEGRTVIEYVAHKEQRP
ncbi:PAS domain S-box protein [Balneola sp. MJW-20]|uniref:PAS domain-containing sensor histidine kinase n=1 Tax=Gracilimonas aurantiaca TaxID=3234185 RepID=UPI003466567E